MSTKHLDARTRKELQPAYALWKGYDPGSSPYAFSADTEAKARKWQTAVRKALNETIGFQTAPVAPAVRRIEMADKGDYTREKIVIATAEATYMPVYILRPKGAGENLPAVVAFHGHGYGVKDIVGLWEDGEERDIPDGYHKDFAVELCRRGFVVAAPEISCFGERQTDFSYLNRKLGQGEPTTCTHTAALAFHLGGSVVGLRVRDGKRLVDYLETLKDVDAERIGAMGISGGGMHTFFSTCLDERIKACVVSGYFCTFRDSILAMHHCMCNFVPGLSAFGEITDLVGLIAPRPMLVESGSYDPIFPMSKVKTSVRKAKQVYSVFGAADAVKTDYFEGRHQISGRLAYDFLAGELGLE